MTDESLNHVSADKVLATLHRCLHRLERKAGFSRAELVVNCPDCSGWFEAADWAGAWEGLAVGRQSMDLIPGRSRAMLRALTLVMGDLTALLAGSGQPIGFGLDQALDEEVVLIRLEHYYQAAWAALADRDDRVLSSGEDSDRFQRLWKVAQAWEEDLLNRGLMEVLAWAGISLSPCLREDIKAGRLDQIVARTALTPAQLDWLKLLPGALAKSRYELHGLIRNRLQTSGFGNLHRAKPTTAQAAAIIKSNFLAPPKDEPKTPPAEETPAARPEEESPAEEPLNAKENLRTAVGTYLTEQMTGQVKREVDLIDKVLADRLNQAQPPSETESELSRCLEELLAGFKRWEVRAVIKEKEIDWFERKDLVEVLNRNNIDLAEFRKFLDKFNSKAPPGNMEQKSMVTFFKKLIDENE